MKRKPSRSPSSSGSSSSLCDTDGKSLHYHPAPSSIHPPSDSIPSPSLSSGHLAEDRHLSLRFDPEADGLRKAIREALDPIIKGGISDDGVPMAYRVPGLNVLRGIHYVFSTASPPDEDSIKFLRLMDRFSMFFIKPEPKGKRKSKPKRGHENGHRTRCECKGCYGKRKAEWRDLKRSRRLKKRETEGGIKCTIPNPCDKGNK